MKQQSEHEHEDYGDESMGGRDTRQQHRKMKMNRSGFSLSQEQKFELIDFIHERPHIWDQNNEGFRSNQSRQSAFNEVAQLLSNDEETLTRIQVQEEWGKLRYCFTRIVKKLLEDAPGGQISEEQMASISWAFFHRMNFLLDSVIQQLHGPGQTMANSGIDGGEGGGGDWAAIQLLNQQENQKSDHSSPLRTKIRRRRRHNANNGEDISNDLSRKSSHHGEFIAEEMDSIINNGNNNNALLNQSTNELLMRQVLGLSAPEMLVANALSTSQHFLQQWQQPGTGAVDAKQEYGGAQNAEGDMSIAALINDAVVQQQNQQQIPSRNLRRKRRSSNLDFLLGTVAQQQQHNQQRQHRGQRQPPLATSTPSKQPIQSTSSLLVNAMSTNRNQSSLLNQPIPEDLSMEAGRICASSMASSGTSPNVGHGQQKQQSSGGGGIEERFGIGGDEFSGEGGRNSTRSGDQQSGGDIIDSFGRYIVQQLRTVHKKSEMLSVELRKELVNLCFNYEMRACKMSAADSGNDDGDSGN